MSYIELKSVQAAGDRLLEQTSILNNISEELNQIEQSLRATSYIEEPLRLLKDCRHKMEEETHTLNQMGECLKEVSQVYRETEDKITDMYNLDHIEYPKTQFGVSQITGLDEYKEFIIFRRAGDSDGRIY